MDYYIATAELISAAFIGIMLIGRVNEQENFNESKWLNLGLFATFIHLIAEALSYLSNANWPFALVYVSNFLSYALGGVILFFYMKYCETYIKGRMEIKEWAFRIPIFSTIAYSVASAVLYLAGQLVVYENGIEVECYDMPVWLWMIYLFSTTYNLVLVIISGKIIGSKAVLLIGSYCVVPAAAAIGAIFSGWDFTVVFASLSFCMIYVVLQKDIVLEQAEKTEKALSSAETANKAKSDFLFSMSHDIRTPMNAILGFSNIAEKHIDDKERVIDSLNKIRQSGNLLLMLINSVLDMCRIESGSAENDEQPGDVMFSFSSIESTLKETAAASDIDLSFDFGEIKDRYVFADFGRCIRILTNIISNAIKYNKPGGYVKVKCEQISENTDGRIWLKYTVEDNGIGMSEEFQKRMFDAFAREHNSTTSGIQGTGLGLSVCKTFADYLGGKIDCKSKQGVGTTFEITLPFRVQNEQKYTDTITGHIIDSNATPDSDKLAELNGKRVLLVEDNELNREIALDILEEKGLIVDEAEDGDIAVEKFRKQRDDGKQYDFILMDIQMPRMNGYEATKAIREISANDSTRVPIIALSANAFEEDRAASSAAGMDEHVAKPIKLDELFGAMAKFI